MTSESSDETVLFTVTCRKSERRDLESRLKTSSRYYEYRYRLLHTDRLKGLRRNGRTCAATNVTITCAGNLKTRLKVSRQPRQKEEPSSATKM